MGSLFSYACAARCRRGRGERAAGGAGSNALNALLGFLLRQTPRVFHLNSLTTQRPHAAALTWRQRERTASPNLAL